jgi:hypothetical protein
MFADKLKRVHHKVLINILSYLPFKEVVTVGAKINRKFYIVAGDRRLLRQYFSSNRIPGHFERKNQEGIPLLPP